MMQNRLKDRDRGGYATDRYRSHDNYTNAFNMLAQIGLAEKEVTNSRHNAVTQAANAYTARKEQEFKRDSWIAQEKFNLNNYQAGQYNLIREKAESTVASRMEDFEAYEIKNFKQEVDAIEKEYKNNPDKMQEERDKVRKKYDARHAQHRMEVIANVNQEFEQILIDMGKYADANANVFNMFNEKFDVPMFDDTKKLIQIPADMKKLVRKHYPPTETIGPTNNVDQPADNPVINNQDGFQYQVLKNKLSKIFSWGNI